jgi:hypothetical protein
MPCHGITDTTHTYNVPTSRLRLVGSTQHTGFGALGGFLGTYMALRHGMYPTDVPFAACNDWGGEKGALLGYRKWIPITQHDMMLSLSCHVNVNVKVNKCST